MKHRHLIPLSHNKTLHSHSWTQPLLKNKTHHMKLHQHSSAQAKGLLGQSNLLTRMISHCPEGRSILHFKPLHSSTFSWIGLASPDCCFLLTYDPAGCWFCVTTPKQTFITIGLHNQDTKHILTMQRDSSTWPFLLLQELTTYRCLIYAYFH